MKKIYAILAVAAVGVCIALAVSSYSSRDSFFEANVEALMNDEGIKAKICYVEDQNMGHGNKRYFVTNRLI